MKHYAHYVTGNAANCTLWLRPIDNADLRSNGTHRRVTSGYVGAVDIADELHNVIHHQLPIYTTFADAVEWVTARDAGELRVAFYLKRDVTPETLAEQLMQCRAFVSVSHDDRQLIVEARSHVELCAFDILLQSLKVVAGTHYCAPSD